MPLRYRGNHQSVDVTGGRESAYAGFRFFAFFATTFFFFATRCCGGVFATAPAARSKRCHASGWSSISFAGPGCLAMTETEHPDIEKMRLAVGTALMNWGDLENALAKFLEDLMQHPDHSIAAVIYFAPNNTETRLYIVDNVINHILCHTSMVFGQELFLCWQKVLGRINKAKESRNRLAHGQIIDWHLPSGKGHARLTGSIYDISRFRKESGQMPGISLNDVKQIGDHFHSLSEMIHEVRLAIHLTRTEKFSFPASRNRVRELAIHLKTSIPSLGVRFDKGLPAQPQPFEEWDRLGKR